MSPVNLIKRLLLVCCFCYSGSVLYAYTIPKASSWVNDYANVISAGMQTKLDALLKDYQNKTGNQLFVLTVPSIEDAGSIEQYSIAVAEKWGIGTKGKDNGILFTVALKEHKTRIEVGYGLEGDLPDALAGRIINNNVVRFFKQGDFSKGIAVGVISIIKTIGGYDLNSFSKSANDYPQKKRKKSSLLFVILFFFLFGFRFFFFPLFGFLGLGGGFGRGGGFGSGGGFGGGMGGGFGGGGASGSW
jgi:uncharacterized protein